MLSICSLSLFCLFHSSQLFIRPFSSHFLLSLHFLPLYIFQFFSPLSPVFRFPLYFSFIPSFTPSLHFISNCSFHYYFSSLLSRLNISSTFTCSRRRTSAMRLVTASEASLRSATTDTKHADLLGPRRKNQNPHRHNNNTPPPLISDQHTEKETHKTQRIS